MTIKEICETIITYDEKALSKTLDAAIMDGLTMFRDLVGSDEYMLYSNEADSISIESITLNPDGDGEDILELVIDNDDIMGLITMNSFLTDYTFLNGKVAEIKAGTDSSGDSYRYIRFKTATDFDVAYVSGTHAGSLISIWYRDMQRAIAYLSISVFIPMAKKISNDISLYQSESYGEATAIPSEINEIKRFAKIYRDDGNSKIRNYYIRLHNLNNG